MTPRELSRKIREEKQRRRRVVDHAYLRAATGGVVKPITVYCAFCHRPQAGQRHLPSLTWACRRELAFKRQLLGFVKAADGVEIPTYVLVNDDGAQQCTSVLDGAA